MEIANFAQVKNFFISVSTDGENYDVSVSPVSTMKPVKVKRFDNEEIANQFFDQVCKIAEGRPAPSPLNY